LSNDQNISRCGYDPFGKNLSLIDFQDALDLGEKAGNRQEIPVPHADQRGDHVQSERWARIVTPADNQSSLTVSSSALRPKDDLH
jgi:hypothetical protein